tara:strand:+ start:1201 stop:2130 length:930 start_codon:yes stop_codon:yes gene_type:complete
MENKICLDDKLESCPVCGNEKNQSIKVELKKIHKILEHTIIEIIEPKKHYLKNCNDCNVSYKSHFPSIQTESYLTDIWKSTSETRYQDTPSNKLKKIAKYIKSLAKSKKIKVLDIGIGEGSYLEMLSDESNIQIYLMDCDQDVLDRISRNISSKIICADIGEKDHIADLHNKFDVITAFDLIEHIPSSSFIKNINFMLKPGGTFLAETGDRDNLFCKFFGIQNWWYTNILEHKVFWNQDALSLKLSQSGFNNINISKAIHKDRRLQMLIKDFIKSIIWLVKIKFFKKSISSLKNPKFPIRDQLFVNAKK